MTEQQILNSIVLKNRFVRDNNLSIAVLDNPYFLQRVKELEAPVFGQAYSKWKIFCYELEEFNSEQDYCTYYNEFKDKVINHIKENDHYELFCNETHVIPEKIDSYHFSKKNLYTTDNDGKRFISVDMKKGNFSQFRYYRPELIDYKASYEEFISQWTDLEHLIYSKYVRQVIFGACNPKKQIQNEKVFMTEFLNKLLGKFPEQAQIVVENLYSLGEDEIIFTYNEELEKLLVNYMQLSGYKVYLRSTTFTLHKLENGVGYYKTDTGSNIEFKCIECDIYNQVIKYFLDEEIAEDDLVVYHNGYLAKYLKPIENPFPVVNGDRDAMKKIFGCNSNV